MITSATIRKITNGFILSTTQTVDSPIGGGPVMVGPGTEQFFPSLTEVFAELDAAGFDDFTQVTQ